MPKFLGRDYLLTTAAARRLFRDLAPLPIIDTHNHADVAAIRCNANYANLWEVEGATDHYVWELLRKRGVPERCLTGNASAEEKWLTAAAAWDGLAGNPCYEWLHLDLQRLFGIREVVSAATGRRIWEQAHRRLRRPDLKPQALLRRMKVEVMCSTDDPADTLEHHRALADSDFHGVVFPTFRPDRARHIYKPDWRAYLGKLEARFNTRCRTIRDLLAVLGLAHDHFAAHGCRASDHGVTAPYGYQVSLADADAVFRKARQGRPLTREETVAYMSFILNEVAALDCAKGWVFQLHLGVVRDVRDRLARDLGPDSGGDISDHALPIVEPLNPLLNRFDGRLKIVLYCLDPSHQPTLATLARAYGETVSLGAAWWFNDSPVGMTRQLEYLASVDLLANFAGMVSDSRKLPSYAARHEMFRRCLADVLGRLVTTGRIPEKVAAPLAVTLAYARPKRLFGF